MIMMMMIIIIIIIVIKVQGAHVAIVRPQETQTPRACNQILPTVWCDDTITDCVESYF